MDLLQAIRLRRSVRRYKPLPIAPDAVAALRHKVDEVNRLGRLNVQLVLDEPRAFTGVFAYGKFSGVNAYFIMAGRKAPDLDERIGYYGEQLVLLAQTLGLNTCWAGLSYRKVKGTYTLADDEKIACYIALGYGETQGGEHRRKSPQQVSNISDTTPEWFARGVDAAILAPTAVNQQKFRFEYRGIPGGDTLPVVDAIALRSLVGYSQMDLGIAKLHFEIGAAHPFRWAAPGASPGVLHMPRRLRVVLFDMDGTLYDSMPSQADAWTAMCRENGLDAVRDDFFLWEGRTGNAAINDLMQRTHGRPATPDECRTLYARKAEIFRSLPPVPVMPGAQQLVSELRRRGMVTVLVTGSGQASLVDRLADDFGDAFPPERRITAADVAHGKPSPEPYLRGMQLVGASPDECLVMENAPLGVESGVASGAFTVGVLTGPIPRRAMADAGADVLYASMTQCSELLPNLLFPEK